MDTISIRKITKGNNSAKNVGGVTVVNLVMLYICAKFHEIISNGIKVIEWTQFLYGKLQRGIIPPKMQVEQLLLISARRLSCFIFLLSFMKFSNGIEVIEWTRFLY